ncbi:MAG: CD225/dispanin family protein, partial [Bacteroidaceae bacterium]
MPLGIYAIVCATKSDTLFNNKQYEEAKKKAEEAKKFSIIGIILGVVAFTVYFFVMLIAGCM